MPGDFDRREYDATVFEGEQVEPQSFGGTVEDVDGVKRWVIDSMNGPKAYVVREGEGSIPTNKIDPAERNPLIARPRTVEVFNALAPKVKQAAQAMVESLKAEGGWDEVKDGKCLTVDIDVSGLMGVDYPGLPEMVEPAQVDAAEDRVTFQRQMALVLRYLANLVLIGSGINRGDVDLGEGIDAKGVRMVGSHRRPSDLMFKSADFGIGEGGKGLLRLKLGTVESTASMLHQCGEGALGEMMDHAHKFLTGDSDAERPGKPKLTMWPSGEPWTPNSEPKRRVPRRGEILGDIGVPTDREWE